MTARTAPQPAAAGAHPAVSLPHRSPVARHGAVRLSRPVHGSVLLGRLPAQPQPRATWTFPFPPADTSPAAARRHTAWFIGNCAPPRPDTDTALLAVSELVSNACTAMQITPGTGPQHTELSLRLFPGRLLIEVIDTSPSPPLAPVDPGPDAETGRGLAVISAISRAWGWYPAGPGRKAVYCALDVPLASPAPEGGPLAISP